jgi:GrpB-like predicted nucleotidyltransferase (UPF0157 family)
MDRSGGSQVPGLVEEPVRVLAYDRSWPSRFEEEKALLERAIGTWATGGIHHVGSTAVPGLDAKPVIDILVGVENLPSARACFEPLARLGYLYAPYRETEMHWFCKPDPSRRTHHDASMFVKFRYLRGLGVWLVGVGRGVGRCSA